MSWVSGKENIKMAVFKNFKDDELVVSCKCGCDEGIHFKIHGYQLNNYSHALMIVGMSIVLIGLGAVLANRYQRKS